MYKLSKSNSKLGKVINANLPAIVTCRPDAPCIKECYACKGFYRMPSVITRYGENLQQFLDSPHDTITQILQQLPNGKDFQFRWHSSGDIVDSSYFHMMVDIANARPDGQFLAFTKKYEIVNDYLYNNYQLPKNLTIVFSVWDGLDCHNPHNLPTAQVTDNYTNCLAILDKSYNCAMCKKCWKLKEGGQVFFKKH